MKSLTKKGLVLLGVATCFGLSAWASEDFLGWYDKGKIDGGWCLNGGTFVKLGEREYEYYGYCYCQPGYWGPQCEYKVEDSE